MWIWLVLLYGVLKGFREICKKKALLSCSSIEVLLVYTALAFLLVCPDAKNAMGMEPKYYFFVAIKSFVIFVAWICSFKAIKHLPISLYGVLDLSRVLFATSLGVIVLGESMGIFNIIGLIFVCAGLLMLKWKPKGQQAEKVAPKIVIIAILSCMLNSVSGLLDKILMKIITSSQLQFWYMLFLSLMYISYAVIENKRSKGKYSFSAEAPNTQNVDGTEAIQVSPGTVTNAVTSATSNASTNTFNLKRALTNKWIWLLAISFAIADRALFIANGYAESQITIMTLLKQAGCIITILGGKFVFKEKNIRHKLICAGIIIAGIVFSVM